MAAAESGMCAHGGCNCDLFREQLLAAAPQMIADGNCVNCNHRVNEHPKQPTTGGFMFLLYGIVVNSYHVFILSSILCRKCSCRRLIAFGYALCGYVFICACLEIPASIIYRRMFRGYNGE